MEAEEYAYEELRLMPWDFWRLTPREFNAMVEGHRKRKRAQLRQEANWVAILANSMGHLKRQMRVEDLIGMEPEERERILRKQQQKQRQAKKAVKAT